MSVLLLMALLMPCILLVAALSNPAAAKKTLAGMSLADSIVILVVPTLAAAAFGIWQAALFFSLDGSRAIVNADSLVFSTTLASIGAGLLIGRARLISSGTLAPNP